MVTFFVCLAVLIIGYIFYSRLTDKIFGPDDRKTPAILNPDGVDNTPLKTIKAFLIELLNIAGTGPIFGAISGALFGPRVFIWIVAGSILGGGVHDYMTGMISSRNKGRSMAFLAGKYFGNFMKWFLRAFSIILLILVTAVFVVSPSQLLSTLTDGNVAPWIFMLVILVYYFAATILPIDKIIGKIYPVFGIILVLMAVLVFGGVLFNQGNYPLLEIIDAFRDFSVENGSIPSWPFMFTTVACGAISGFHATQAPMISKCIKSERQGRRVFYGAMVAEGIIALVWAAVAMAFYNVNTPEGWSELNAIGGSSAAVYEISSVLLGPVGSILAVIGVVICPVTSGDTALRSCRLIISEIFRLDQKRIRNRILLTLPLFALVALVSLWNFLSPENFNILWRWFAWSNQTLACIVLWVITKYLLLHSKYKLGSLISALPAIFMSNVVITYFFGEPEIALGRFIPMHGAHLIGFIFSMPLIIYYIVLLVRRIKNNDKINLEEATNE